MDRQRCWKQKQPPSLPHALGTPIFQLQKLRLFDFSKMESAHYEGTRLYIVSTSKAMIRGLENDGWDRQELKADISSARCRRLHRLCAVWGTLYETCLQFKKMVLDIRQTSPWSGCSTSWSLTRSPERHYLLTF